MAGHIQDKGSNRMADKPKPPNKQWAELFKTISKPSSGFKLQKWKVEDRGIDHTELRNLGICLVGFMLGRFTGWQGIQKVRSSWNVDCTCTIHETGWMIFRFQSEEDRDSVLEKGPYESMGVPWILKKLPPYFSFKDECFNTIPTWIRLYGLPLDLWTENALGKIASYIGEPVAADEGTVQMTKTSFARLLVEVEVNKPLIKEVQFSLPDGTLFTQLVTYEREPKWCPTCRMMSHNEVDCRRRKAAAGGKIPASPQLQGPMQMQAEAAPPVMRGGMEELQEDRREAPNLTTTEQPVGTIGEAANEPQVDVSSQLDNHTAQTVVATPVVEAQPINNDNVQTPEVNRVKGKELENDPMTAVLRLSLQLNLLAL